MLTLGSAAVDRSRGIAERAGSRIEGAVHWLDRRAEAARFVAAERAVSNWRMETAATLEPMPVAALAALVDADGPVVTRCVKLNNYWCIKSARWEGELGADDEGHVGFASAEHGADAAAGLLRRYYLEFGRKSALDVVRRWAPAECNLTIAGGPDAIAVGPLAVRGIGATVRARWLASHRKVRITAAAPKSPATGKPRVSATMALNPGVPAVAPGAGGPGPTVSRSLPERVKPSRQDKAAPRAAPPLDPPVSASASEGPRLTISSSLPYRMPRPGAVARAPAGQPSTTAMTAAPSAPRPACVPDEQRLRNYAAQIVAGLGIGPTEDLKLFEPDGTPAANLTPVLLAMSAFELGTLRASGDLVAGAVARQAARAKALAPQAGSPGDAL